MDGGCTSLIRINYNFFVDYPTVFKGEHEILKNNTIEYLHEGNKRKCQIEIKEITGEEAVAAAARAAAAAADSKHY